MLFALTVLALQGSAYGRGFKITAKYMVQNYPSSVAVADFNGDNHPDIVTTYSTRDVGFGGFDLLLNNGDGTFQAPVRNDIGSFEPGVILAADFNHNGKQDVALLSEGDKVVWIVLGNGDGTFQPFGNVNFNDSRYAWRSGTSTTTEIWILQSSTFSPACRSLWEMAMEPSRLR